MSIITKTDNGIIYKLKDELVCIEAYGRDIIRVRITRNSTLSDEKWTLLDVEDCSFETEITEGKASVTSGILRSEICDLPWGAYMLSFYKNCSLRANIPQNLNTPTVKTTVHASSLTQEMTSIFTGLGKSSRKTLIRNTVPLT